MSETEPRQAPPPNSLSSPPTTPGELGRKTSLPLSRLAIWALVCGGVGLLITPFAIAGIVLGIMALRRLAGQRGERGGQGLAIGGIVAGFLGIIIGIVYAFMFWSVFQIVDVAQSSGAIMRMASIRDHAVAYAQANQASYPAHVALLATQTNNPVEIQYMVQTRFRKSRRSPVTVGGFDFADDDDSYKSDQAIIAAVESLDTSATWYKFGDVNFVCLPHPTNNPSIVFCWITNPDTGAFVSVLDDGTTGAGTGDEDWAALWQADAAAREMVGLAPMAAPERTNDP